MTLNATLPFSLVFYCMFYLWIQILPEFISLSSQRNKRNWNIYKNAVVSLAGYFWVYSSVFFSSVLYISSSFSLSALLYLCLLELVSVLLYSTRQPSTKIKLFIIEHICVFMFTPLHITSCYLTNVKNFVKKFAQYFKTLLWHNPCLC